MQHFKERFGGTQGPRFMDHGNRTITSQGVRAQVGNMRLRLGNSAEKIFHASRGGCEGSSPIPWWPWPRSVHVPHVSSRNWNPKCSVFWSCVVSICRFLSLRVPEPLDHCGDHRAVQGFSEEDSALPHVVDGRRLEVVDGPPLLGGAQLALDTTLVCALHSDGRGRTAVVDGFALTAARQRKVMIACTFGGHWRGGGSQKRGNS